MNRLEPLPITHYLTYRKQWPLKKLIPNILQRIWAWILFPFEGWRTIDQEVLEYSIKWINEQPKEKLPHFCTQINNWEWIFPEYKEYYDNLSPYFFRRREKSTIISPIHAYLNSIVLLKESFRDWHLTTCNRTNEEFEIWWVENETRIRSYSVYKNIK